MILIMIQNNYSSELDLNVLLQLKTILNSEIKYQ